MLEQYFEARGWACERTGEGEIVASASGSWAQYELRGVWRNEDQVLQFLAFPDIKVASEKRAAIYEALGLINEQLWLGHFEMWSGSGLIVFRHAAMRCADLALYSGKEAGRGGHAFFKHQMYVDAEDYRSLENDVRNALGSDGLALHYQPIIDSRTGKLVGREALLRWSHPVRGPIPPDQFVPIIEDAGLIHQIGDWVIREACSWT